MEDSIISKIKTQIEEIEKRIKAIAMQMTTTSQITAVKLCLDEIKQLLIDFGTQFDEHTSDYETHKQNYETLLGNYNSLYSNFNSHLENYEIGKTENNSAHSELSQDIENLTTLLQDLEAQADALDSRIAVLEESAGGGTDTPTTLQTETTKFMEYTFIEPCIMTSSIYYSPRVYFTCELTQPIEIQYTIQGSISGDKYNSIKIYINDDVMIRSVYNSVESGNFKYELDPVYYYSTKKLNHVMLEAQVSAATHISKCSVKIIAKNINIFNEERNVRIICFNNKYYISYPTANGFILYGVQDKNNLALNVTDLTQYNFQNLHLKYERLFLLPALQQDTQILTYDETYQGSFLFGALYGDQTKKVQSICLNSENLLEMESDWTFSATCLDVLPQGIGDGSEVFISTSTQGTIYMVGRGTLNKSITYNNELLDGHWFYVCFVKNNNLLIGSEYTSFDGFVAWRDDDMNVFFPDIQSTYCVEIAPGKNATAYMQTNGNIYVYISRGCDTFRYELQKNLEGKYELSDVVKTIKGVSRYEELYDDNVLAYQGPYFILTDKNSLIIE